MRSRSYISILTTAVVFLATALFGCTRRPAVCEYRPIPIDGWETCETLTFDVDSLAREGDYLLTLSVRTSAVREYPYRQLALEVRQNWQTPFMQRTDTLTFDIAPHTSPTRHGVTISQHEQPCGVFRFPQGTRGSLSVRHLMRHAFLPGISEVGIILERAE